MPTGPRPGAAGAARLRGVRGRRRAVSEGQYEARASRRRRRRRSVGRPDARVPGSDECAGGLGPDAYAGGLARRRREAAGRPRPGRSSVRTLGRPGRSAVAEAAAGRPGSRPKPSAAGSLSVDGLMRPGGVGGFPVSLPRGRAAAESERFDARFDAESAAGCEPRCGYGCSGLSRSMPSALELPLRVVDLALVLVARPLVGLPFRHVGHVLGLVLCLAVALEPVEDAHPELLPEVTQQRRYAWYVRNAHLKGLWSGPPGCRGAPARYGVRDAVEGRRSLRGRGPGFKGRGARDASEGRGRGRRRAGVRRGRVQGGDDHRVRRARRRPGARAVRARPSPPPSRSP